jgi:hypothetical protein
MKVEPLKHSPYVGPRPFQQSETRIFFGRYRQTRQIVDRILVNRLVVIYGQSGTGKTSFLHAGIIPQLEKEGVEVLPPARVKGPIPPGINAEEIRNFYAFNCIRQSAGDQADLRQLTKKTLAEYFKERQHAVDWLGQPLLRAFILDQVEELLSDLPQYWQHREPFFRQLHDALEQDHLLRVVLVTREDALGSLESHAALLPDKPQTRFRLELLRKEDALSALIQPLKEKGVAFEPAAAERLVDELLKIRIETAPGKFESITGEFIEPLQLQLVGHKLWEGLPIDKKVITKDDIDLFPNVEAVLSSFYDRTLRDICYTTGIEERRVRDWFEHALITSSGIRKMILKGSEETGGLSNRIMDQLVNKHIVRVVVQGGAQWYELAHDRFIQPVLQSNQKYRSN